MPTRRKNEYQARIKDLDDARKSLNKNYLEYRQLINSGTQEEIIAMYAVVLQSAIFLVDLQELNVLFNDKNDSEGKEFSSKCNLRMAALRIYERMQSLPLLYLRVKTLAEKLGVKSNDEEYSEYFSRFKKERNALSKMSALRHTAGHYDGDARKFIDQIDSVVSEKIYEHAVMAINIVTEFNKYVFVTLMQCMDKKTTDYELTLALLQEKMEKLMQSHPSLKI